MEHAKAAICPMSPSDDVHSDTKLLNDKRAGQYCSTVGSRLYIALKTRPDIATSATISGKDVSCSRREHYVEAQRVVRYLLGTMHYILKLRPTEYNQLRAYSDASRAGETDNNRRRRSGIILYYGEAPIDVASSTQKATALSTSVSKYMALLDIALIMKWLLQVCRNYKFPSSRRQYIITIVELLIGPKEAEHDTSQGKTTEIFPFISSKT